MFELFFGKCRNLVPDCFFLPNLLEPQKNRWVMKVKLRRKKITLTVDKEMSYRLRFNNNDRRKKNKLPAASVRENLHFLVLWCFFAFLEFYFLHFFSSFHLKHVELKAAKTISISCCFSLDRAPLRWKKTSCLRNRFCAFLETSLARRFFCRVEKNIQWSKTPQENDCA